MNYQQYTKYLPKKSLLYRLIPIFFSIFFSIGLYSLGKCLNNNNDKSESKKDNSTKNNNNMNDEISNEIKKQTDSVSSSVWQFITFFCFIICILCILETYFLYNSYEEDFDDWTNTLPKETGDIIHYIRERDRWPIKWYTPLV
jgi:choline-glycine betaine transporter